ncbi:hypothetical protein HZC27_04550 [Candidatus Roizmanbacteria bacterium]|nr:hypothetical protein [Candidatus Roizmanbacteria bacterium]
MSTSDKQQATLFLIHDLLTHARAQAVVKERTLTDLVERASMKYLPKKMVIKKVNITI